MATMASTKSDKKVIDIVDLSDDEDQASSTKKQPQKPQLQNGLRLIPTSQLKNSGMSSPSVMTKSPANFTIGIYIVLDKNSKNSILVSFFGHFS